MRCCAIENCADEIVVGHAQAVKGVFEGLGVAVGPFQSGHAVLGGGVDHLGGVLIGPGEEEGVIALQPVEACDDVGDGGGIHVPDMWPIVDVVDRCGDIELVGHAGIVRTWAHVR